MKLRFLRRAGALLMALTLVCSLLAVPASAAVTSVTVTPSSCSLEMGKTITLTANVQTNDGPPAPAVTWSSRDPNIATVDSVTGEVTPVAKGTATIYAVEEASGKAGACSVTVTDPKTPVTSVQMDTKYLELTEGERATLSVTVRPESATDKSVTYTSADPDIVSVTSGGQVTALKEGSTTVTATANDQSGKSDFCIVTVRKRVIDLSQISISLNLDQPNQGISIPLGGAVLLKATVTAPEGVSTSLTWRSTNPGQINYRYPNSSDSSTVEIYATGSARVDNEATIIATSTANENISAVCAARVVNALPPKISSVEITTSPTADGRNYVDPGAGNTLRLQAVAYPASAAEEDRRITWTSSNPSVATVDPNTGIVTGRAPGETVIRASAGDKFAERTVEVSGLLLSYVRKSTSGGQGTTVELKENTEVEIFQYRDITVSYQAFGNARGKTINWESSNPTVAQVVNGRVTGNYPGSGVTISAAAAGTSCSASFKVRVSEDVADAITVDMGSSPSYALSGIMSQLNSRSQSKAGAPLDYVYSLKVSTENGVLYYKYNTPETPGHGVGGTERYYYQPSGQNQMGLRDVTFVPLPGFDGTAVVDYSAMATNGSTFSGTIRIEAETTGDVSYSTGVDQPVSFSAEHFSAVCQGRNGRAIRYVTFTQPSSDRGTLYYNYSSSGQFSQKVSSSTRYYASSSPSIDNITFVPAEGYVGNVDIAYHCVDSSGASYHGTVTVRVTGAGSGGASSGRNVEYSISRDQSRVLNGGDFNDACRRTTGVNLDHIRFNSLPSSSAGTLYLNYSSSSSSRVSTSRSYYRSSSPLISSITFVPAPGYSGTVSIPFTGVNTNGASFSGNLIFHVGSGGGSSVSYAIYYTGSSLPIPFRASDFQGVCQTALGSPLSYVRFNAAPSVGRLYQGYSASSRTGSVVNAVTHYGVQDLGQISYVPKAEYQGTLTIPCTLYDTQGHAHATAVGIQLSNSYCAASFSDTASGWDWAKPSIEYLRDCGITSGYRNNTYRPGQSISRGEFTLMICRAFQFPTDGGSSGFPDVPRNSTYAGAIASARDLGIVQGNRGRFQPDLPITRQSAMTMIGRAMEAAGQSLPAADTGLLSSYADGSRVSAFARPSVAALIQMGAVRGNSASRLNPGAAISRAEMAVILHRVLTR